MVWNGLSIISLYSLLDPGCKMWTICVLPLGVLDRIVGFSSLLGHLLSSGRQVPPEGVLNRVILPQPARSPGSRPSAWPCCCYSSAAACSTTVVQRRPLARDGAQYSRRWGEDTAWRRDAEWDAAGRTDERLINAQPHHDGRMSGVGIVFLETSLLRCELRTDGTDARGARFRLEKEKGLKRKMYCDAIRLSILGQNLNPIISSILGRR
jgi:hypothetical protein